MIIDNEAKELLKPHLITILEPICDADPDTLADYVIALIEHDAPNKELKNLCISQLEEFLKTETENFVNQLFKIIETKSYLPGYSENNNNNNNNNNSSYSKRSRDDVKERKEDSDHSDDDRNFKHRRKTKDSRSSSITRKPEHEEQTQQSNKKHRTDNKSNNKSSNREHNDNRHQNNRNSFQKNNSQEKDNNNNNSNNDNKLGKRRRNENDNDNPKGNGKYIRNNNNNNLNEQNNQNRFRGRNQQQFRNNNNNNGMHPRQRCIDYDEKGYCLRGNMCPFDHGMDRIVVDELGATNRRNFDNMMNNNIPPRMMPGMNQNNFYNQFMNRNNVFDNDNSFLNTEGYDPEQPSYKSNIGPSQWGNSVIDNNNNNNLNNKITNEDQNLLNQSNNDNSKQNNSSQNITNNRGRGRGRGRGGFSRHRQSSVKQPILNIENIPVEHFAIDKINNYFKKFGTIININLDPRHYKATIQFSQYSEANQAYSSPDPIFGNRFVKLYWAKTETEENENSTTNENDVNANANANTTSNSKSAEEEKQEPPLSSEEMDQINKMKKSMISKQLEKQKAFMKQVENPGLTKPEKEEILNNIKLITESVKHIMNASPQHIKVLAGNILQQPKEPNKPETSTDTTSTTATKPTEETEKSTETTTKLTTEEQSLKEKVESLKAEAQSLGIDPSSLTATSTASTLSLRGRGGYRARGRGLYPWGRGGRSFKLDNRPTKLLIKGFSKENQSTIKHHFELFGLVENYYVSKDGLSAIVHYQTRREAEQALAYGKKVEGIDDTLELSWFTETPDPNLYETPTPTSTTPGASNAVAEALAQLADKINKLKNPENKALANLSSTLENLNKSENKTTTADETITTTTTTVEETNEIVEKKEEK